MSDKALYSYVNGTAANLIHDPGVKREILKLIASMGQDLQLEAAALSILQNQVDSQRDITDPQVKPIVITPSSDVSVTAVNPLNTTGGFTVRGPLKGFDYYGKIWYVFETYDNSIMPNPSSDIYGRNSWTNVLPSVKTEYFSEDGSYLVNVKPVLGFLLGDPHGNSINLPILLNVASLPTTGTGTNLINPAMGTRYNRISIVGNVTGNACTLSYKTYRNNNLQTISIPVGVSTYNVEVSFGDFITEVYCYTTGTGNSGSISVNLSGFQWSYVAYPLNLTVFLQGADRNDVTMGQELKIASLLPTTDPYGSSAVAPNINSMPNVVDWVQVQLGNSSAITTIVDSKPGLLMNNGQITDVDGISPITFNQTGTYYIIVKHRNHLRVATPTAMTFNGNGITWDFTTDLSQAYVKSTVTGNDAMVQLSSGRWALWGGNANGNTNVRYNGASNDNSTISASTSAGTSNLTNVYNNSDVDMNGDVVYDTATIPANTISDNGWLLNTVLGANQSQVIFEHI